MCPTALFFALYIENISIPAEARGEAKLEIPKIYGLSLGTLQAENERCDGPTDILAGETINTTL